MIETRSNTAETTIGSDLMQSFGKELCFNPKRLIILADINYD